MKKIIPVCILLLSGLMSFAQSDTVSVWRIINFETPDIYIVNDTSGQNLWQTGQPDKPFFNSSWSFPNAMVTDTMNNYPANNQSWFDLYISEDVFQSLYPYNIFIDFKHKYDTDTLKDGCFITVSYNMGLTWMNIIHDTVYDNCSPGTIPGLSSINLYGETNTLFNGEYGFSGNSGGWINTTMAWFVIPCKQTLQSDTMIIRFNFISDSTGTGHEGWMIDDIKLYSMDLGGDIAELNNSPVINRVFPNPNSGTISLDLNIPHDNYIVSIYNNVGTCIFEHEYHSENSVTIPDPGLEKGIYYLKVKTESGLEETRKIVVVK